MEFSAKVADASTLASECLVVGMFKAEMPELTETAKQIDKASKEQIRALLEHGDLDGGIGDAHMLYDLSGIKAKRVLLLGLGNKTDFNASAARRAVATAVRQINRRGISAADLCLVEAKYCDTEREDIRYRVRNLVEAIEDELYYFDQTKSKKQDATKLQSISLLCESAERTDIQHGINEGSAVAGGVMLARNYANLPGNICTPSFLAKEAQQMATRLNLEVTVLDEAEMKRLKMGALLSVSRGSREPAKFIVLEYNGGKSGEQPIALVGKGLTFDAGGISIKPASAMDEMKYDMCGGASVLGAVQAAAELKLKLNIVGIIPSSENLPDGAANKPGDIVTSMAGITIEVLNTDAEGRLILCDALTYAERFKPTTVVDIATLTGACKIALGENASGLFSNSDTLAGELIKAGDDSGDRAWRLPAWDEYDSQLESNFADLANIGGRYGGAITAACFLKHFTKKFQWAHLDVAGSAWLSGGNKGATGRPVPLLVEFLLNRASAK